ncbi:MAG: 4-(cytidine 5'-diphospho)-2-C-methyl-D-erythritol kinase [Actinomycetota bacterium]|nr:4-(cytidine 5'-diphospho)-2-C-methyl-D-erythritol kinase [Actinomycetota bacterium]MEC9450140.1 4-(cytidine 5'-diphospho)-2-C-methyl-D-erythritol kinase [Actinomycetota bacterium]
MTVTLLSAPAKLTLSLSVVGVRHDGYHLVDAEMVAVDLTDELEVSDGEGLEVVVPDSGLEVSDDGDNLVARALRLVGRTAHVVVRKSVPAGAGLGGGSADAAAILRWAGWDDVAGSVALGADVPFCLVGGRARVTGIGEVVEPLPFEERAFTLLTPPVGCLTQDVYRRWDEMGGPLGAHGNDLEPAAVDLVPALVRWRDELEDAAGCRPKLAGSGSTWFVEGEYPGEGRRIVRTLPSA